MTRPAAPDGYVHADAAAELLGVDRRSISAIARREGWRSMRDGRHGLAYVTDDVRASERKRRA